MPISTSIFKKETIDYVLNNFNIHAKILDVGAGIGTYSDLLRPKGYKNIDCVEIYQKYIDDYNLKLKYNKVMNQNVIDLDEETLNYYDLIIFGDVIEHISKEDSLTLFNKIQNKTSIIVAVPFMSPQGKHFGNIYETHLQDEINFTSFLQNNVRLIPFCVRYDYGIFLNVNNLNKSQDIYVLDLSAEGLKEAQEHAIDRNIINLNETSTGNINIVEDQPLPNIEDSFPKSINNETTFVTALWNIKRDELGESFARNYEVYLERFKQLLKSPVNMYIFVDKSDEDFIWENRSRSNTVVRTMSVEELADWFPFTEKTNEIRQKPEWLNQVGWLPDSTQAKLEMYNPLVMSKMFMLNNVTIWNPFDSQHFYWIDAGLTSTVHWGYFTHDKVHLKLPSVSNKFMFIAFPYAGGNEIHGFTRTAMNAIAGVENIEYVCRGGFFGGNAKSICESNKLYYSLLERTLNDGYMGTEESIFTLMSYIEPENYDVFAIEENGLIGTFFENLKNNIIKLM